MRRSPDWALRLRRRWPWGATLGTRAVSPTGADLARPVVAAHGRRTGRAVDLRRLALPAGAWRLPERADAADDPDPFTPARAVERVGRGAPWAEGHGVPHGTTPARVRARTPHWRAPPAGLPPHHDLPPGPVDVAHASERRLHGLVRLGRVRDDAKHALPIGHVRGTRDQRGPAAAPLAYRARRPCRRSCPRAARRAPPRGGPPACCRPRPRPPRPGLAPTTPARTGSPRRPRRCAAPRRRPRSRPPSRWGRRRRARPPARRPSPRRAAASAPGRPAPRTGAPGVQVKTVVLTTSLALGGLDLGGFRRCGPSRTRMDACVRRMAARASCISALTARQVGRPSSRPARMAGRAGQKFTSAARHPNWDASGRWWRRPLARTRLA